jgi:hypothetical protein
MTLKSMRSDCVSAACGTTASEELSEAAKETIRKTADWILKNPDKKDIIFQRSKGNPKFK